MWDRVTPVSARGDWPLLAAATRTCDSDGVVGGRPRASSGVAMGIDAFKLIS